MKQNYDNPLRRQCFDVVNLALPQFDLVRDSFENLVPDEKLKGLRRVVVTGCGDSYLAAVEAKGIFDYYLAGTGCKMEAVRAIDAARYLTLEGEQTLVVAISASGGPARIAEILQRGKKHGCLTMALTNNGESRAAQLADYVYLTNTPAFPDAMPGLRSYFASMAGLYVMAVLMAEKLTGKTGLYVQLREVLAAYNAQVAGALEEMDEAAFRAADAWKESKGFEVTADGPMFACGEFVAAKYAEVSGDKCTVIDSENYWHVNSILRPLGAYGTVAFAFSDEANLSRMADTVNRQVTDSKRSILLVADKPAAELGITSPVIECRMPAPEKPFGFLLPLYAYIPGSLAAGYQAALIDEPYFRGGGKFFDPEVNTLKTNEIRVL